MTTDTLVVPPPTPAVPAVRPPTGTGPTPVGRARSRLLGVDAARGVALLGMIAIHALPDVDPAGNATASSMIAGGTSAALFAVLAGVGVAFMTKRRRVRFWEDGAGTTAMLAARAVVVGVIGLALGEVTDAQWGAVILPYYALLFLLAVPLVHLGTRALVTYGAVALVALPALDHLLIGGLPVPIGDNPSFTDLAAAPGATLSELALTGYYPAVIWTVYLAFGIVLGRLPLGETRVATRLLLLGTVTAVVAKVVSTVLLDKYGGLTAIESSAITARMDPAKLHEALTVGPDGVTPAGTWWWEALATAHSSTPLDLLYTLGVAAAVVGLMLRLGHVGTPGLRSLVAVVRTPLAAAGSMTLTLYTLHILFMNSPYDDYGATTGFVVQVVAALAVGTFWWATAGRGPLEAVTAGASRRAARLAGRRRRPEAPTPPALPPAPVRA